MKKRASWIVSLISLWVISAAPLLSEGLTDSELSKRLDSYLIAAEDEGFSGAVLAARDGKVVLEKGYGIANEAAGTKVVADTVFTTGSVTKQFTAAAIMKLVTEGKLAVKDPIRKYFDDAPGDKAGITLHQLLTHSAGFEGAIGHDLERIGRDEFVESAFASKLLFEPGSQYEYSNVGYSLLAAIVEKVSGKSYEVYLRKHFFRPAGMRDTGYLLPEWDETRLAHGSAKDGGDWGTVLANAILPDGPGWNLVGNGGIHSTVGDMYRWHLALESGEVLPRKALEEMYSPWVEEPGGTHYGYGWSIETTPRKTRLVAHNGGNPYFFSDFWRFLDEHVVLYYSTNSRDRRFQRLMPALASIIFEGQAPPLASKSTPISGAAAAEGSAAARWGLPDDPRADAAACFLDALSLQTEQQRQQFVEEAFGPGVIERNGVDGLAGLLVDLREELGDFDLQGLDSFRDHGVEIRVFSKDQNMPFSLQLDLEDGETRRIVGLGIEAGD